MSEHFIVGVELGAGKMRIQGYLIRPQGADIMGVVGYMTGIAETIARENNLRVIPFVLVTGPLSPDTIAALEAELKDIDPKIAQTISEATDVHTTIWLTEPGAPTHESIWGLH